MNFKNILLKKENNIGILIINRPDKLNALNIQTLQEIGEAAKLIREDDEIKVLILTGAGDRSFVAGADISEMANEDVSDGMEMGMIAKKAFCDLEDLPIPTIAAINGFALGGGCELAMVCDIRVAADTASFGQPECHIGTIPGFGGTQRLARLVGAGRAKEIIYTCNRIDADEAYRIGLVNHVVPKNDLMSRCVKMAEDIMKNSMLAVALAKEAINTGLDTDLDSGLTLEHSLFGVSFASYDRKEGMQAFVEKRLANFKGK